MIFFFSFYPASYIGGNSRMRSRTFGRHEADLLVGLKIHVLQVVTLDDRVLLHLLSATEAGSPVVSSASVDLSDTHGLLSSP